MTHPSADLSRLFQTLQEKRITVSLRHDARRRAYLRWSPHFYNTEEEIHRAVAAVRAAV